ncbi:S-4TM family putative pore-forming effector [Pelotomaculum propionicicum]|uniref:Uncharacterized protein n=1 Tax=Pelotomaculum propionicicum TaxID=258475 RepID=A0A4Y7RJS1_9FIRM|nr:S-4TM family putative pore-forming effector [Pelotomaculum propionicicum]TEB09083.1 hypothetical protein Pmgp_03400 [Pelotomaculum propionicicum]
MPSPIAIRQNEEKSIRLLVAQRQLYSTAKFIRGVRILIAILIAALGPLLVNYQEIKPYLALLAWWVVIDQHLLSTWEIKTIETAAAIQEEFDIYVLGIPEKARIGKIAPEVVFQANEKFRGKPELTHESKDL